MALCAALEAGDFLEFSWLEGLSWLMMILKVATRTATMMWIVV